MSKMQYFDFFGSYWLSREEPYKQFCRAKQALSIVIWLVLNNREKPKKKSKYKNGRFFGVKEG